MNEQASESDQGVPVLCAWCGSEIRREETCGDSERESRGMCQTCFRRMIEEHARAASQPPAQEAYAGER
jgi:hypothetical protein